MALGSVLEGQKMLTFANHLLPSTDLAAVPCAGAWGLSLSVLATSLALLAGLTALRLPLSLTNVAVGAMVGGALHCGLPLSAPYLWSVFAVWMASPLLTALLTYLAINAIRRFVVRMALPTLDLFDRTAVTVVVFAMAYSLGANNVGLVNALAGIRSGGYADALLVLAAVACGAALLGRGVSRTMGSDLIVLSPIGLLTSMFTTALVMWALTQFGVPMSATQMVVGGILGAGLSARSVLLNKRLAFEILGSWPAATALSVVVGYLAAAALR